MSFPDVHFILDDIEISIENDAHQPVATQRVMKQFGIFRRAAILDLAIAEQDSKRTNRRGHLPRIVSDSVRVYAERTAHREDIDGLHGLHRKPLRIEKQLQLLPSCTALHVQDFLFLVKPHLIEAAHVEDESVLDEGVAAHAVPRTGGGRSEEHTSELQSHSD